MRTDLERLFAYFADGGGEGAGAGDGAGSGDGSGGGDGSEGSGDGAAGKGGKPDAPLAGKGDNGEGKPNAPLVSGKTADGDGEGGEPSGEDGTQGGAPDQYEDFTMPEGFSLEGSELESVHAAFKKADLSQEAGQLMVDTHAKVLAESIERQNAALIKEWDGKARESKEYGGEQYEANKAKVNALIDKVLSAEERAELEPLFLSPWGWHPVLFALLHRVATRTGEDVIAGRSGGTPEPKTRADKFYGTVDTDAAKAERAGGT